MLNLKEIKKLKEQFDDEEFIVNVCMSYDHSFGLMSKTNQNKLIFECKEWMRAIGNNLTWEMMMEASKKKPHAKKKR